MDKVVKVKKCTIEEIEKSFNIDRCSNCEHCIECSRDFMQFLDRKIR